MKIGKKLFLKGIFITANTIQLIEGVQKRKAYYLLKYYRTVLKKENISFSTYRKHLDLSTEEIEESLNWGLHATA